MAKLKNNYLMVAALDFGTTYSGYAFSMKENFKSDPLKIRANQAWNSGGKHFMSLKTPTCILLDAKKDFDSFGYDAENTYADILMDGKQDKFYYFHRFKMNLHNNKNITLDMMMEDISGKPVSAIHVFSLSIKALTSHLIDKLAKQGTGIHDDEIRWVLTVPAIWTDSAKQFMRRSANAAGISDENLLIALEPECASIYCQYQNYLPTERLHGPDGKVKRFLVSMKSLLFSMPESGQKYMVIDLGGGTADITVHQKMSDNSLKEICRATGSDCGGTSVDSAFFQMMAKIFGAPLMNLLKKEDTSAYLDLFREFETVKRTITSEKSGRVNITVPYTTLDLLCKKHLREDFPSTVHASSLSTKISLKADKMRFEVDLIKTLFESTIQEIIKLIGEILQRQTARDVPTFLLVGGFSECVLVQDAIQKKFKDKKIVIPDEAEITILKGAVLFGHKPDYITSRILGLTYGIRNCVNFDKEKHGEKRRVLYQGIEKCDDEFNTVLKSGVEVPIGTIKTDSLRTFMPFQHAMDIEMFCTREDNPKFVDEDGMRFLGKMTINIPEPSKETRYVDIEYHFGNTELRLKAIDRQSKVECETSLNLLL
ncbi:heat shock 70 kDa protein 12A-like [Mytilus edulis]|uniref:heat shock 70 kDa protein 12A-like n=1 Tax=Mytilus edulis TaxID=6550 RepID=UPI0039EEEFDE